MTDFVKRLDDTNNKANILFDKYLGYVHTGATSVATEYQALAMPKIPKTMIMADDIPDRLSLLGVLTSSLVSINYKLNSTATVETKGYTKKTSSSFPHIVKYENVPLKGLFSTTPDVAFIYEELTSGGVPDTKNLLENVIAPNFGDKNTYGILVEAMTGTDAGGNPIWMPVSVDKYVLDRDAGVITFFAYTTVNKTNPPRISFWRYEGTFGTINRATDAVFGKNGNDAFYDLGSVAIGKQTVNNLPGTSTKFSLDVSGSLNVDGVILQNGVPITGVLDQNPAYNFTSAENAPGIGIDASGDYAVNVPGTDGRDNYTSAIYKIDKWIYNYMMAKPAAIDRVNGPSDLSGIRDATELTFYWRNNPTQYKFAFTSKSLPAIDTISAQFDISGNLSKQGVPILTNNTRFITDVSGINALILSKNPGTTGYTTRTINGDSVNAYIYYSPDIANATDDIKVRVWYNNSALGMPNIMDTYTLGQFMSLFPPSVVRTVDVPLASVNSNGATITWVEPEFVATSATRNYLVSDPDAPAYAATPYKITYTQPATNGTERYGNPRPDIAYDTDTASPFIASGKLASKTTYTVGVSAKNAVNSSYGQEGTTTFTTGLPDDTTSTIAAQTINFSSYTNTANVVAIDAQSTAITNANIVLEGATVVPSTANISDLAVCNTLTYASTDAATLSDGTRTATLGAFGTLAVSESDPAKPLLQNGSRIVDLYPTDDLRSGLFAKLNPTKINLYPGSAGTAKHTLTLTHTISKGGAATTLPLKYVDYYVDSLPKTAIATVLPNVKLNELSSGLTKVCGISVVGGTNQTITQTMNDISITNAGYHFFNNTANTGICTIAASGTGVTGINGTDFIPLGGDGTGVGIPTIVPTTDTIIAYPSTGSNSKTNQMYITFAPDVTRRLNIPLKFTPYNLNGMGVSTTVNIPVVVDQKAFDFVNPVTEPSPIGAVSRGMRVHFGTMPSTSTIGSIDGRYNMDKLLTSDYPNELLYADGKYMYKTSASDIYINYDDGATIPKTWGNAGVNYSNIPNELNSIRAAAFSWVLNKDSASGTYNTLNINILGLSGSLSFNDVNNYVTYNTSQAPFTILYRTEDFDNSNSPYAVTDTTHASTIWLNAFIKDPVGTNTAKMHGMGSTSTEQGGYIAISGSTVSVSIPSLTPTSGNITNKVKIHVIIGIPSDTTDITFTDIKCNLS